MNRFLRIFPVYWAALALLSLLAFTGLVSAFDPYGLYLPKLNTLDDYIGNVTLLWGWGDVRLLISQSWSLRIEIFFYLAMLFLARNPVTVAIWLIVSIAYCVHQSNANIVFFERYTAIAGSSIAFAAGAAIYFLNKRYQLRIYHIWLSIILFFGHLVFANVIWGFPRNANVFEMLAQRNHFGLYAQIFVSAYLTWALFSQTSLKRKFPQIEKAGKQMGDIAYAIFLTHWIAVVIVCHLGVQFENKIVLVPTALIVTHLISIGLFRLVERPINDRFRDKIRP